MPPTGNTPPQKILLYTHALTGGGAERVWALLASGFARRGSDVIFVTDFDAPENASFLDPAIRRITLGGGIVTNVLRLAQLLAKEKPDVSLSALSASNFKHALAALFCGRRRRAILSFHGYATSEPQLLSQTGFALTAILTRLTAASVCVSDGLLAYVVQRCHGAAHKCVRIYNPVDGGPLAPAADADALRARGPVVLSAGRFVFYKQFPALVRAFALVTPANAKLVLLGEGPERANIEAEVRRLGLEARVSLPGYAMQPWGHYAQSACFALASSQEPFGLVIAEALMNGLPVVAANSEGPREILGCGKFGVLAPIGDEVAMANAISAALAEPGDPAPRIARAQAFTVEKALDEYQALIKRVIERGFPHGAAQAPPRPPGSATATPDAGAPIVAAPPFKPRKIVFYVHALTGGGAERAMTLLASGLARRGHEVIIATDYISQDNDTYLDTRVRKVLLGTSHARSVLRLRDLLLQERPDVSISALGASNLKHTITSMLAGRPRRAVLSYHGFVVSEPRFLSRLGYFLIPLLTRLTGRTIAVSNTLRSDLLETWHADPARTLRIYNPVVWGDAGSPPNEPDIRARPPSVLASGRLIKLKRFDTLLRAFARVEPGNTRLIILGEGPERAALGAEARRLGIADRVEMPGYIREPWKYYAMASCFVITSVSESFGMVAVEALAYGLPLISTDCRGPSEIVSGMEESVIVPIDDERALAAAITASLANPGDPAPRVQRAQNYLPETAVENYERMIGELCDPR